VAENLALDKRDLDINIENVVASADINQRVDLLGILKVFRNVEYNPKRFPGLVFRLKRPKTATLIFSSGKMVCTGARSSKEAHSAVRKVVRELKKNNIVILNRPIIEIQNMVASANLKRQVDLETASDILDNVMYEPEQFPGLIYRMSDPKTVLLIFTSGKIVCTGGTSEKIVHRSINNIYELLDDYELFF
jgi:transcription initiation factor TFIID TATA-box-binding protein